MRTERKLFICAESHALQPHEKDRVERAQATWVGEVRRYETYKRTALNIGDRRNLPYLKDVLENGMKDAGTEDIVCFVNSDIHLHPELPKVLNLHCSIWGACTAHRSECRGFAPKPTGSPEQWAEQGQKHMGRDLFAATKEWMVKHWNEIPDAILGAPMFDLHLAALVRMKLGFPTTRQNLETVITPAELPNGYIAHESHEPTWSRLPMTTPSHRHNVRLFQEWSRVNLPSLRWFGANI